MTEGPPLRPDPEHPKVKQLMEGALSAFAELGYEGSSTDEIARRAGVSKATMYKYFRAKEDLYELVVRTECTRQSTHIFAVSPDFEDLEEELTRVGRSFLELLVSDRAQQIYRLAVGEANRFPALARTFYEVGPDLGARRLSQLFTTAAVRGLLTVPDPELAAQQFLQLCQTGPFFKLVFRVHEVVDPAELEKTVAEAVRLIVQAYAPNPKPGG